VTVFQLPARTVFMLIAVTTVAAMGFAMYLQYIVDLAVCPLCFTQRVFVIGTGVIAAAAALQGTGALGTRIHAGLGLLFALTGGGFAARHVWLQHLPPDQAPACGPSLEYMLETLPFSETLNILLMGDGNCAEVVWTLLGFSIPEMTPALFVTLSLALAALVLRPE